MAAPTSYTEAQLRVYLNQALGATADEIGWTLDSLYFSEVVNEALLVYGVDAITEISGRENIRKLRLVARRELWRAVMASTAHYHAFGASQPGALNTSEQQIYEHAKAMFEMTNAQVEAEYPNLSAYDLDIGYLDTDSSGDEVAPIFQREAFGNTFKDWDSD